MTTAGLPWPRVDFMTWPANQPSTRSRPPRTAAAWAKCAARATRHQAHGAIVGRQKRECARELPAGAHGRAHVHDARPLAYLLWMLEDEGVNDGRKLGFVTVLLPPALAGDGAGITGVSSGHDLHRLLGHAPCRRCHEDEARGTSAHTDLTAGRTAMSKDGGRHPRPGWGGEPTGKLACTDRRDNGR